MVVEIELPKTKGTQSALGRINFSDTFATTNHVNSLKDIVLLIFGQAPKWVSWLFRFRNFLVRFIGLKTDSRNFETAFYEGGHLGFFEIFSIADDEVVLGANDRHLNFRVSIFLSTTSSFNVQVSTLVEFNNQFGRLYLGIIKPFHRIVVKSMVKQAYRAHP